MKFVHGFLAILCLFGSDFVSGVRITNVHVPAVAHFGDKATLLCDYDLEGEPFHSLTWYKDDKPFYKFSEIGLTLNHVPGIQVNLNQSTADGQVVILENLNRDSQGLYTCDVLAKNAAISEYLPSRNANGKSMRIAQRAPNAKTNRGIEQSTQRPGENRNREFASNQATRRVGSSIPPVRHHSTERAVPTESSNRFLGHARSGKETQNNAGNEGSGTKSIYANRRGEHARVDALYNTDLYDTNNINYQAKSRRARHSMRAEYSSLSGSEKISVKWSGFLMVCAPILVLWRI